MFLEESLRGDWAPPPDPPCREGAALCAAR
jgi:hypothetical protein